MDMPNIKNLVYKNLGFIFISLFFVMTLSLLWVPPRWDEYVYLNFYHFPLNPTGHWVPHPPLIWYLLAVFSPVPRITILMCSAVNMLFLFYACKRLYGAEVAGLAVAILATNWLYMLLGSLIMFTDGPVTAFMSISTIAFLCWLKLSEKKFLLISGLGLALASVTKYTAAPIILATSIIWLLVLEPHVISNKVLKTLEVFAVSLLPLLLWFVALYQKYGNFFGYYSTLYNPLPSTNLFSVLVPLHFSPFHLRSYLPLVAFNIGYYAFWTIALASVSLIPWIRKHQFDLDSKLLLAHMMVIFVAFVVFNKQDPGNFRYVLPMAPSIAIISAKNMIREEEWRRFLVLFAQFLCASIIAYLALSLYIVRY